MNLDWNDGWTDGWGQEREEEGFGSFFFSQMGRFIMLIGRLIESSANGTSIIKVWTENFILVGNFIITEANLNNDVYYKIDIQNNECKIIGIIL